MENYLSVKQAITRKFPAIEINESMDNVIHIMAETDASVLAVKSGDELLGMVTVSDVVQSLANDYDLKKTKVSTFMTECRIDKSDSKKHLCIQLDEDQDIISAIKVMFDGGINHLLVTGEKNKPLGIISSMDLIKLIASKEKA
jgi:predicted transcriptional regulator